MRIPQSLAALLLASTSLTTINAHATGCVANLPGDIEFVADQVYGCNGTFAGGVASAAPLCDVGYSVCDSVSTLTNLGLTEAACGGLPDTNSFFASLVSSQGGLTCSTTGTDDVFGCARNEAQSNDDLTEAEFGSSFNQCGPLVAAITSVTITGTSGWSYNGSGDLDELTTVSHSNSMGGVLCCADGPPPPPPPQISNIVLSAGPAVQQLTLAISGSDLTGTISTPDSVTVGGESCQLISSTPTLVNCHVPTMVYESEPVTLTVEGSVSNSLNLSYIPVDSDRDGLTDDEEIQLLGTLPDDPDSDDDGLSDGNEVLGSGTNPNLADSDVDGESDIAELAAGSDPNDSDSVPPGGKEIPAMGAVGFLMLVLGILGICLRGRRGPVN